MPSYVKVVTAQELKSRLASSRQSKVLKFYLLFVTPVGHSPLFPRSSTFLVFRAFNEQVTFDYLDIKVSKAK